MTKNSITPKQYLNKTGRFIYFNPLDASVDEAGQPFLISLPTPYEKTSREFQEVIKSLLKNKVVFDKYLPDNT